MADVPRPIAPSHLQAVLRLNNASARETSLLDAASLESLVRRAAHARLIEGGEGAINAFIIALDQWADYDSINFRWFKARLAQFLYVDRIVVAQTARRRGLARQLYDDLFAHAHALGQSVVACEVNLTPPNPQSDAFHAALGFTHIGTADVPESGKAVRYLVKDLTDFRA